MMSTRPVQHSATQDGWLIQVASNSTHRDDGLPKQLWRGLGHGEGRDRARSYGAVMSETHSHAFATKHSGRPV